MKHFDPLAVREVYDVFQSYNIVTPEEVSYRDFDPSKRPDELFQYVPSPSLLRLLFLLLFPSQAGKLVLPSGRIKGGDISRYQTVDNYGLALPAGVKFMVIKATESTYWTDPKFTQHWQNYLDAGLYVMVYHFFRSNYSGVTQAEKCLNVIKPLLKATNGQTIVWLDVETADGVSVSTRRNRINQFVQKIQQEFRQDGVGIYSSPYLWGTLTNNMALPPHVWGWVAHWANRVEPTLPKGWVENMVKLWQIGVYPRHSWTFPIPGIRGEVDCDYFMGTDDELVNMLGGSPVIPPLPEYMRVANCTWLNGRADPYVSNDPDNRVIVLKNGQIVQPLERSGDWYRVHVEADAWCHGAYLESLE